MRNYLYLIILFTASSLASAQPSRVPARRDPIVRTQPNGDTLTILLRGDERSHRTMTLDGWQIKENNEGYLCYATQKKGGDLVASKRVAHNPDSRSRCERSWLKRYGILIPMQPAVHRKPVRLTADGSLPEWYATRLRETGANDYSTDNIVLGEETLSNELSITAHSDARMPEQVETYLPTNIAPKGLVIIVNFNNLSVGTPDGYTSYQAYVDTMMNGESFVRDFDYAYDYNTTHYEGHLHHEGSARQYFEASSFGQYSPSFDIIGPVTLPNSQGYYGANSGGRDQTSRLNEMLRQAAQLADTQCGVDFSQYDHNNDGAIDFVYILYAGLSEADTGIDSLIWPCSSTYYGESISLDGKRLGRWAASSEMNLNGHADGLGTIAHEFGHVLGLPDIYATNNASHKTLGTWDVMDYGCYNNEGNTPPLYNAMERFMMGWLTPQLLTSAVNDTLLPLQMSNEARMITASDESNLIGNDPAPTTYWLLENRQQTGWDAYLPGHGLMLTKITNSSKWSLNSNTVNNTSSSMGFDLIEADGVSTSAYWAGKATDLFPAGATSYEGIESHPITDITESEGVITYKYKGGVTSAAEYAPTEQYQPTKILRNGQVLIYRDGIYHTILGL